MSEPPITYGTSKDFDLKLKKAIVAERRLGWLLLNGTIELKTEDWQWERTGNICIEYACRGKPSGIAATKADVWVHELVRRDKTLLYILVPVARLKELVFEAFRDPRRRRERGGEDKQSKCVVLRIADLLR